MKKSETNSSGLVYLEITNKTKSCIVINSFNLILKPKGEVGDSIIIDESKTMDNDVIGLHSAGLVQITTPKMKKPKKLQQSKKLKKPKIDVSDKKGSKVIYVDRGKVKKGKMTRNIQDLRLIDTNDNNKSKNADNDKTSGAFVDSK